MSKGKEIGIDLGTTYSCVAVWEHDRAEVIVNDRGNRTTPSVVAFTPSERFVGDSAKYQIANNPHNTVFDAKRLIGRRFTDSSVQSDAHLWPFTVVAGDNGEPVIQVEYKGERRMFAAEEISSMDADGSVPFFWGTAPDGCLVLSDDPHELKEGCGKYFAPFPRGCFFSTSGGLQSFEYPLNKLMPMPRVDSKGQMCGANFKVDVFAKRQTSMHRVGSEANSAKEF